jgi:hypothetical protein
LPRSKVPLSDNNLNTLGDRLFGGGRFNLVLGSTAATASIQLEIGQVKPLDNRQVPVPLGRRVHLDRRPWVRESAGTQFPDEERCTYRFEQEGELEHFVSVEHL